MNLSDSYLWAGILTFWVIVAPILLTGLMRDRSLKQWRSAAEAWKEWSEAIEKKLSASEAQLHRLTVWVRKLEQAITKAGLTLPAEETQEEETDGQQPRPIAARRRRAN